MAHRNISAPTYLNGDREEMISCGYDINSGMDLEQSRIVRPCVREGIEFLMKPDLRRALRMDLYTVHPILTEVNDLLFNTSKYSMIDRTR